ncbi:DUF4238 domain-containing protein [Chryseobacterium cucumeris]|uniref:DUF4238 domain-containing protein n=2 Tax=Chryseobacterium TaxID=59732 RepID=UPI0037BF8ECF
MKEQSKRHHYIPKFLSKNFSDENNMLWVYNKESKRIISKMQSPKAIFFEDGRNLFDINGNKGDNIERMYEEVDTLLSKTLTKILKSQQMSGRELTWMIYLANLTKWRVPKVDDIAKNLVKDIPIEQLGLAIRPIDSSKEITQEVINNLNKKEIIQETKRILLSIQPISNEESLDEIHKNCFITFYDKFPSLIGDCPIIEEDNLNYKTMGNFIFPLSDSATLVCKKDAKKEIKSELFYIWKDLNIFHLSQKYVACKSRDQLEKMEKLYKIMVEKGDLHFLQKAVFDQIV